jgi:molybdopterin/thiamine biosynthesis adenylyltransferase
LAHLIQVGAGSGGMPVLDMLCRAPRLRRVTLIEPDIYKPENVDRHMFPASAAGKPKAMLARDWVKERRPDIDVDLLVCDLTDPAHQDALDQAAATATIGVCAADNEPAKFRFDALMRRHGLPWTLGEVLSGGIGGFVHWFVKDGPCYGCVASYLQRAVQVDNSPPTDYSQPGGAFQEVRIPATKASVEAIASLHALVTLRLLEDPAGYRPGFTTILFSLERVPDVFDEAFRPYRFSIPRSADCLICRPDAVAAPRSAELDTALDQALARLGHD